MWSNEDIEKHYHISKWGQGYFEVNAQGEMMICPARDKENYPIKMIDVINEIENMDVKFPVVLRFHDILRSQVIELNRTFREIIEQANYKGRYQGVYPIKVNQMREVVEEILDAGERFDYGLEAGSKTELQVALAYNTNPNALTILNGYKDEDYLRLAMVGLKMGRKIIIVIEKFSELENVIDLAQEMKVTPILGVRAKLGTKGHGKWADSGGEKAKFGLETAEMIRMVQRLKDADMINSLKLFHFHIGSQIPDIRIIKDAITEGARIYCELFKMGVPLEYFDVGGGLGVDYDGSQSSCDSSINYEMYQYIQDVIYILKQTCDLSDVQHPNIVSESGRSITAHHSCVITKVFGNVKSNNSSISINPTPGEHILVKNMRDLMEEVNAETLSDIYHDACQFKDEAFSAFKLGVINLEERAKIETLYTQLAKKIHNLSSEVENFSPDIYEEISEHLTEQLLCNFSVFQSAADVWAINQLLPILPITQLSIPPESECTLADITCDSDGRIKQYISPENVEGKSIRLPNYTPGKDYFIGIFLTGAYQDIMGDMHNLFGRVNEIHVFQDTEDPEHFYVEEYIPGNSSYDILKTMQYNPDFMALMIKKTIDTQIRRNKIKPREGVQLADFYESCLKNYTYLSHKRNPSSPSTN